MKTYDPNKIDVIFGGVRINRGLVDGTWLAYASNAPGFSKKIGVDGEVTRSRSHDRSGTLTLTLMQSSEVNNILSALYRGDRDATNGSGPAALIVQDRSSGAILLQAEKAWIADDPDPSFGAEAEAREWTIDLARVDINHAGNPDD